MPDPGGGPEMDPPDDTGPSEEEVEDLSVGPGPGMDASVFSLKVVNRFRAIGRAEEKLKVLRVELKNFKAKYFQAWSKNRTAMKPELQELEEKVKQQTLLLGKLKEKSGAFKEKFENERRFVSQSSACSVDQPQHMDDPGPSASAPLPPCKALESPAATSQGVESENGTLTFIQRMESPLRGDKFVMSDNPSEVPEDVQKNQPGNEDEPAPNPLNMDVAAPACAETCSSTTTFAACVSHTVADTCNVIASPEPLCVPAELIDADGGGGQNTAPCAVEAMDVSVQPALSSAESPVLMEENRPAEDSTSTAVGTDTAGKTAGHVNIPASINNDSHDKTMNVVGGGDGEGVNTAGKNKNDISLSAQRKDSSIVQTKSVQSISAKDVSDSSKHTNISSAGRNMGSYASVVGSRTMEEMRRRRDFTFSSPLTLNAAPYIN
ncbi:uncharacterized protein LOC143998124 [Lithobates pipiens]